MTDESPPGRSDRSGDPPADTCADEPAAARDGGRQDEHDEPPARPERDDETDADGRSTDRDARGAESDATDERDPEPVTDDERGSESDSGSSTASNDASGPASNDEPGPTSNDEPGPASNDEPAPPSDDGLVGPVVGYVLELTVALAGIVVRILWTGSRVGARWLSDTESRRQWRRWLLLDGDRTAVVGAFVVGIFALALVLGVSDVIGVRESRFVTTMFSTMIAGLFSFIPIVVAVNQLIISRLFGTPDRLTERIDGVQAFRRRVEGQTEGDGVSPTDPAPFLARLAGTLGSRAGELVTACSADDGAATDGDGGATSDGDDEGATATDGADGTTARAADEDGAAEADGTGDPALGQLPPRDPTTSTDARAAVCGFASRTREHAEALSARLTGDVTSVFDVVLPTIDHDYAGAANEARRLEERFDEDLTDRHATLLEELRELFVTADATRQYFTTIYLQRELARLSRLITYSGTAAILLSSLVIMIYASGYPPVAFEGWLLGLVSLALAVAFSPLAVLFAYVVRVSTVLRRTSAPGAFTPTSEYHRTNATDAVDGEAGTDARADGRDAEVTDR